MRKLVLGTLLAGFSIGCAAQAPLAFKGLRLGANTTADEVSAATGLSCGAGYEDKVVCNGGTTIAEAAAAANFVISKSGTLQRMSFYIDSDQFDGVFLALVEKLGNPQSLKQPTVQNAFGAKFQDLVAIWRRKNGLELMAHKFGVDREKSVIIFTTSADRALLYGDKVPKKLARDL